MNTDILELLRMQSSGLKGSLKKLLDDACIEIEHLRSESKSWQNISNDLANSIHSSVASISRPAKIIQALDNYEKKSSIGHD